MNYFKYPLSITEENKELAESIEKQAEILFDVPIESLSYSTFKLYKETGSRLEYEMQYMQHRKMLCAFSAMVIIGKDKYLDKLCDIIFAVCDEFTWALPAHVPHLEHSKDITEWIDLFSSETSMSLCEISSILAKKLPDLVIDRIRFEVEGRIIKPYINHNVTFSKSNWSAVCGCGLIATFIYMGYDKETEMLLPRLIKHLDTFLDSYAEDGCCMEGAFY